MNLDKLYIPPGSWCDYFYAYGKPEGTIAFDMYSRDRALLLIRTKLRLLSKVYDEFTK